MEKGLVKPGRAPVMAVPSSSGPVAQLQALAEVRMRAKRLGTEYTLEKDNRPPDLNLLIRGLGKNYRNNSNLYPANLSDHNVCAPLNIPPHQPQSPVWRSHAYNILPVSGPDGDFRHVLDDNNEPTRCMVCQKTELVDYNIPTTARIPLSCGCGAHGSCLEGMLDTTGGVDCFRCRIPVQPRFSRLMTEVRKGKVSGASVEGIKGVLDKMMRPEVVPKVSSENLVAAICRLLGSVGFEGAKTQISAPTSFDFELFDSVAFEPNKKSGILAVELPTPEYTNRPTKGEAHVATSYQAAVLCARVLELEESKYSRLCRDICSQLINNMAIKREIIFPEPGETDKTRLFFLPGFQKYKIDRVLSLPIYHYLYNRGPMLLGFQWADGGALDLYGLLQGGRQDYDWWDWDFRRMDQSIKAILILQAYLFILPFYREDSRKVIRILAAAMGDYTACKFVKWLDEDDWRATIGMMFSGELGTSVIDTWVSAIGVICYQLHVLDALRAERSPIAFEVEEACTSGLLVNSRVPATQHPFVFKVYGDDGIAAVPRGPGGRWVGLFVLEGETAFHGVMSFKKFLLTQFDLELKTGAYHSFPRLDIDIDQRGEVVRDGPTILHRRFLKTVLSVDVGEFDTIGAFRPTYESLQRLFNSSNPCVYPETFVAKVVGSMYDTQGMNPASYKAMELELELIKTTFYKPNYCPVASYSRQIRNLNPADLKQKEWLEEAIHILKKTQTVKHLEWRDLELPNLQFLRLKYLRTGGERPMTGRPIRSWYQMVEAGDN